MICQKYYLLLDKAQYKQNTRYTAKTTGYGSPCGAECSDFKLLQLIRNNPQETYSSSSFFSSSDLFTDGSTFNINNLSKQFVNSDRLNSGKRFEWSFSVSISGANENAVATISFNKE